MSIRMQAIKAHMDVRKGQEFDAPSEHRANELEACGLAQRVATVAKRGQAKRENPAGEAGPLSAAGGRAGKRKRSS